MKDKKPSYSSFILKARAGQLSLQQLPRSFVNELIERRTRMRAWGWVVVGRLVKLV
jgi:hypothetical protein